MSEGYRRPSGAGGDGAEGKTTKQIAKILGRPLSSVHLFEGHVGGGFGVRGELYPEDVLVCAAASAVLHIRDARFCRTC